MATQKCGKPTLFFAMCMYIGGPITITPPSFFQRKLKCCNNMVVILYGQWSSIYVHCCCRQVRDGKTSRQCTLDFDTQKIARSASDANTRVQRLLTAALAQTPQPSNVSTLHMVSAVTCVLLFTYLVCFCDCSRDRLQCTV